jgi:hypothetical protein
MKHIRRACYIVAIALPLFSATAEGMERKCSVTPGGRPVLRGAPPLYVVDGIIIGEESDVTNFLTAEQIDRISISCVDVKAGDQMVGRVSIDVLTKAGVVSTMRSQLQRLVERQDEHRARTTAFATDLAALGFFTGQQPAPIEMTVTDAGWSATARFDGSACHASVIIEAGSAPDVDRGVVNCVEAEA